MMQQVGQKQLMDLAHNVRTSYNELMLDVVEGDGGYVVPLDFNWNTKAKAQIRELWSKMDDWVKENTLN